MVCCPRQGASSRNGGAAASPGAAAPAGPCMAPTGTYAGARAAGNTDNTFHVSRWMPCEQPSPSAGACVRPHGHYDRSSPSSAN